MTPSFSCLIATCGDAGWEELAWSRAYPSAFNQGFDEVIVQHHSQPTPSHWYVTVADARNLTLRDADCDYVVFLDADDELEPGYLEALKAAWLNGAITEDWRPLLAPAVRYVRNGSLPEAMAAIPNRGRWPELNELVIGTAVPRTALLEIGGFGEWQAWEDWAAFLKLAALGSQIVYVEDAVYRYHESATGRNQVVVEGPRLRNEIIREHRDWAGREGVQPLL